ncbi:hypothetical protein P43SY_001087 [Pythium insidiosum]|uniref:F-box domain-containing protein n=1 Tax=Pythium insidiosum TaxID=114742 RepID=A0AAD5Q670_PYTIN|nr:hypothetical protein P43SY_001087 [Pythium insidiosum]
MTLHLLAFLDDITAFLRRGEQQRLAATCRILRTAASDARWPAKTLDSYVQEREPLEQLMRQLVQSPGSRRRRSRLRDDQVRSLVHDLTLVALGIRPSCLVDVCALDDNTITHMLSAFDNDTDAWRSFGFHRLRCISFAGNIFFAHAAVFTQLKALDVVSSLGFTTFIDASRSLERPQPMPSHHSSIPRLRDTIQQLLQDLSATPKTEVIAINTRGISPTALAGVVLCYPVVYHVAPTTDDDSRWSTDGNCLDMCPLHVVQTAIRHRGRLRKADRLDSSGLSLVLQEFSAPQHLFAATGNSAAARSLKRVISTYRRTVERALRRALARGNRREIMAWQPVVSMSTRVLPHVGL